MAIRKNIKGFISNQKGTSGKFDVNLEIPFQNNKASDESSNAKLTITLKVFLRKKQNGNGLNDIVSFNYQPWTPEEWKVFTLSFERHSKYWDIKFWLILYPNKVNTLEYHAVEKELAIIEDLA
jgi:hypothetical protein